MTIRIFYADPKNPERMIPLEVRLPGIELATAFAFREGADKEDFNSYEITPPPAKT